MQFEVLMRFVIGILLGACIWALGHKARAHDFSSTTTPSFTYRSDWQLTGNSYNDVQSMMNATCTAGGRGPSGSIVVAAPTGGGQGWYDCSVQFGGCTPSAPSNCVSYQKISGGCPSGYTNQGGSCVINSCGADHTLQGGTCVHVCPAGQRNEGGSCVPDVPLIPAGQPCGNIAIPAAASPGGGGCVNGTLCYFDSASNQHAVNGQQVWYGPARSSGQACSGQPNASGSAPTTQCPPGKVPGTINGQTVCFTATTEKPAVTVETSTQTSTNAQGQTTTGPTTTTTTTDRGTGGVTTDQTTTNTDGSSTRTTSNDAPADNGSDMKRFCDENPEASACKSSTWGGNCGAFACDGDAVECAMAKEMHQRNCALYDTPTSLSTLGNQVSTGADPQAGQNPALEANRQTVNLTGALSQDTFLNQGGLTDQQIVVTPWLTVSLPWSQLNFYLSLMGSIVVAFALVFAARLVAGAR